MADIVTSVVSGVGAVTGVIALIRTGRFKTLDVRLELRKGENDLRILIDEMHALMQRAVQSRTVGRAVGRHDRQAGRGAGKGEEAAGQIHHIQAVLCGDMRVKIRHK